MKAVSKVPEVKWNNHNLWQRMKRCGVLYLMVIPGMISVFIFDYIPIYGIVMAFQNFRPSLGYFGSEFVGLKNFIQFIEYPYFEKIMRNTIMISLWSFMTFPFPIVLAIMFNELRSVKYKRVVQTISYAPHFVSTVVVCSITILLCDRDGVINVLIRSLGGETIEFMSESSWFAPIYTISGLWSELGWGTVLYLAALSGISLELVEAAKMDGAGRLKVIWHVYLPQLAPTIVIKLIMQMGNLLSVGFEKVYALQNPLNMEASSVIATYAYQVGMVNSQYSYSAAIGLFNNIVSVIMVLLANTISKKISSGELGLW